MRITKQLAKEIALKLTKKQQESISQKIADKKQYLYEKCKDLIPKEVMEFYEKYPNYVQNTYCCHVGTYYWVSMTRELPSLESNAITINNVKDIQKHQDLCIDISKDEDSLSQLRHEIETTLLNLKTFKNVREVFPEAVEFLPAETTTAIAVNVNDLRKKLNN